MCSCFQMILIISARGLQSWQLNLMVLHYLPLLNHVTQQSQQVTMRPRVTLLEFMTMIPLMLYPQMVLTIVVHRTMNGKCSDLIALWEAYNFSVLIFFSSRFNPKGPNTRSNSVAAIDRIFYTPVHLYVKIVDSISRKVYLFANYKSGTFYVFSSS